jgi:phosphohistidine phosphatase SixA
VKLFLVRHSEAGGHASDPQVERERPLTEFGIEMAEAMAELMLKSSAPAYVLPNFILCSPYQRAVQTADIFGRALGIDVSIASELSPDSPAKSLIEMLLADDAHKRPMVCGHHDNLVPAMCAFGGDMGEWARPNDDFSRGDFPMMAKAGVFRVSIDRQTGEWVGRDRYCPSEAGYPDIFF